MVFAQFFFVNQFGGFFVQQELHGGSHFDFVRLGAAFVEVGKHVLQLAAEFFHAGRAHHLHGGGRGLAQFDVDFFIVQFAPA